MDPSIIAIVITGVATASCYIYFSFKPIKHEPITSHNTKVDKKDKKKHKKENKKQNKADNARDLVNEKNPDVDSNSTHETKKEANSSPRKSIELAETPVELETLGQHEPVLTQKPKKTILKKTNQEILLQNTCVEFNHNVNPKDEIEILHTRGHVSSVCLVGDDNVSPWSKPYVGDDDDVVIAKINTSSNTSFESTNKIDALKDEIKSLETSYATLEQTNQNLLETLKRHEKDLKSSRANFASLEKNLKSKSRDIDDKQSIITSLEKERNSLNERLKLIESEKSDLANKLNMNNKEYLIEHDNVRTQINKLNNENQVYKMKLQQEMEEKRSLIEKFNEEIRNSKQAALCELDSQNSSKLQILEKTNIEMTEQLRQTQEKLQEFHISNTNLKNNVDYFQKQLEFFKNSQEGLEMKHKSVVDSYKADLEQERQRAACIEEEKKSLLAQLKASNAKINSIAENLQSSQQQGKLMTEKCNQLEKKLEEITSAKTSEIKELQYRLEEMKKQSETNKNEEEIVQLTKNLQSSQQQGKLMTEKCNQLEKKLEEITSAKTSEINELQYRLEEMKKQSETNKNDEKMTSLQEEIVSLKQKCCEQTKQIISNESKLTTDMECLKTRLQDKEIETNNLKRELKLAKASFDSVKSSQSKSETQLQSNFEKLSKEFKSLQDQNLKKDLVTNEVMKNLADSLQKEEIRFTMNLRIKDTEISSLATELEQTKAELLRLKVRDSLKPEKSKLSELPMKLLEKKGLDKFFPSKIAKPTINIDKEKKETLIPDTATMTNGDKTKSSQMINPGEDNSVKSSMEDLNGSPGKENISELKKQAAKRLSTNRNTARKRNRRKTMQRADNESVGSPIPTDDQQAN